MPEISADTDTDVARIARSYALAPGLFLSLKKGGRRLQPLDVEYRYGQSGAALRFSGSEQLDSADLRVFQAILSVARSSGTDINEVTDNPAEIGLRRRLDCVGTEASAPIRTVEIHPADILRKSGLTDTGSNRIRLRTSLERMAGVRVESIMPPFSHTSYQLIATDDAATGRRLRVAFNPTLSAGITHGQYARISLRETRTLESPAAHLIHQRLCAWIDPGRQKVLSVKTLCGYVWGPESATGICASTKRRREMQARRACDEIDGKLPGWLFERIDSGRYRVTRPDMEQRAQIANSDNSVGRGSLTTWVRNRHQSGAAWPF